MANASGYMATNYGVATNANYSAATGTNYAGQISGNYGGASQSSVYNYNNTGNPAMNTVMPTNVASTYGTISQMPSTIPSGSVSTGSVAPMHPMNSATAIVPNPSPSIPVVGTNVNATMNTPMPPNSNIPTTTAVKMEPAKEKPTKFDLLSDLDNIPIPAPTLQPIKTTEKPTESKPPGQSDPKPESDVNKPEPR